MLLVVPSALILTPIFFNLRYLDTHTFVSGLKGGPCTPAAPRESIVGQHNEVRRRGRGGAAGLLESTRRIRCETETSRLTEMRRSCGATVSPRLFKPVFCILQPFFLCWPSQKLPPAESTCTSGHSKATRDRCFVFPLEAEPPKTIV